MKYRKIRTDRGRRHRSPHVRACEHLWAGQNRTVCGISCLKGEAQTDPSMVTCGRCIKIITKERDNERIDHLQS